MKDISMFIQMHKGGPYFDLPDYYRLQVGALRTHTDLGFEYSDKFGENISAKNRTYVDLCGVYWIWKNVDDSFIVGNTHHSKYFIDNKTDFPIQSSVAKEILKENDIVIANAILPGRTVYQIFNDFHGSKNIDIARDVISRMYPDYIKDFDEVIVEGEESSLFNMMITYKTIWNDYCAWLFPILEEMERYVKIDETDDFSAKVYGFVAERLELVWIHHHKLKYHPLNVRHYDENLQPVR